LNTNDFQALIEDSNKLFHIREWAKDQRYFLDNHGPSITTADGEYMDVAIFEHLENILDGNDQQ